MRIKILFSVIIFFGLSSQIIASPIPMEKFDIGVGYNTFADEWYERLNSRDGFAFFINTPIDIGSIEFAISTEFFENTFPGDDDITTWTWSFGWHYTFRISRFFHFSPGILVGSYRTNYYLMETIGPNEYSSENLFGYMFRISIPVSRRFSLYSELDLKTIYAEETTGRSNFHLGLKYTLNITK